LVSSYLKMNWLLPSISDNDLWNSAVRGDREAFGQLFRRYYSLLFQYGLKICSDEPTLEDCIQELFVELWQKKPDQEIRSVKAYLLQALKFKLYRSFRDRKPVGDIEAQGNEPFELSHETFMIDGQEKKEMTKRIADALNQLPPRQKEIIYLKIYKGLSYEEVSHVMEINYQVVRNLLCQALKTFRKLIVSA
jgi:RNA polymerase sigma factor (sigma-70 family)